MSATNVLSQLTGLLTKTKQLQDRIRKVYPTDGQWSSLSQLSLNLAEAVSELGGEIQVLRKSRTKRAWQESGNRLHANSTRGDLFAKGRLKQQAIFRRNCAIIFEGPKDSSFDSDDTKSRKESTRARCGVIQSLSPDGIISWAMAYAPTLWAGGSISAEIFNCLIDYIEPELVQTWPPVIQDTLRKLKDDEEYLQSPLNTTNSSEQLATHPRELTLESADASKRSAQAMSPSEAGGSPKDQAGDSVSAIYESPAAKIEIEPMVQTGRQIQYMYSMAPAAQISLLGGLLSDAETGITCENDRAISWSSGRGDGTKMQLSNSLADQSSDFSVQLDGIMKTSIQASLTTSTSVLSPTPLSLAALLTPVPLCLASG